MTHLNSGWGLMLFNSFAVQCGCVLPCSVQGPQPWQGWQCKALLLRYKAADPGASDLFLIHGHTNSPREVLAESY